VRIDELQQAFAAGLLGGELGASLKASFIDYSDEERDARFAVYRNNVMYALGEGLADLYPTIKKLLGEEFFNGLAACYNRAHPPRQAAMVLFGREFPAFISTFEHTRDLSYLRDVAQLDLARHVAYYANDEASLEPDAFSSLPPEVFAAKRVAVHSACQLLSSPYAIMSIWELNQQSTESEEGVGGEESGSQPLNVDSPEHILVMRQGYKIQMLRITDGLYAFLLALKNSKTVVGAFELAMAKDESFNPADAIALLITSGFVVAFLDE